MAAESRRSACTGTMMVLVFLSFIFISIADAKPQFMYSAHRTQHQHHDNKPRAVIRNVRQNSPYYQQLQPIAAYAAAPVTHNRQYRDDVQQATQVTYENAPVIQANNDQTVFAEQQQQPYVAADVSKEAVQNIDAPVASSELTAFRRRNSKEIEKEDKDADETFYTCCIPIGQCIFRRPKEPAGKPNEKCQCWNCQGPPPPFWPPFPGPPPGPGCGCPLEYPPPIWRNAKGKKCHCNWMNNCNNFDCGGNFWGCDFMPNWCNVECGNKTAPVCKPDGKPCSCPNCGWSGPHGCDDGWEMGIGFICQKCKAKDCFKPPQPNFGCNHHGHGPHHCNNNNPCVFDMMYDSPYY